MPCYFLNKIDDINIIIGQQQLEAINQIINIFKNKNKEDKIEIIKKTNIQKSVIWCEKFKIPSLTSLTEGKAPHIAIGVVAVIAAIFILNNHTETLVTISNAGLIVTMLLVSASVTLKDWNASKITSALLSGVTTAGFGGLLAMCSM